jgi:hypothetical protein
MRMEVTMGNMTVPRGDGRRQYSMVEMAVGHAIGHIPLDAFEEVGYGSGRYMLKGSWPTPKPSPPSSSGMSSVAAEPDAAGPTSTVQARSLWPALR